MPLRERAVLPPSAVRTSPVKGEDADRRGASCTRVVAEAGIYFRTGVHHEVGRSCAPTVDQMAHASSDYGGWGTADGYEWERRLGLGAEPTS